MSDTNNDVFGKDRNLAPPPSTRPINIKVLRLSRPRLRDENDWLSLDVSDIENIIGDDKKDSDDEEGLFKLCDNVNNDLSSTSSGMSLPKSFGAVWVGEPFVFLVAATTKAVSSEIISNKIDTDNLNESKDKEVKRVNKAIPTGLSISIHLPSGYSSVPVRVKTILLKDDKNETIDDNKDGKNFKFDGNTLIGLGSVDIKQPGTHQLVVSLTYKIEDNQNNNNNNNDNDNKDKSEEEVIRKVYRFTANHCLAVRTKVTPYKLKKNSFIVQAQVENTSALFSHTDKPLKSSAEYQSNQSQNNNNKNNPIAPVSPNSQLTQNRQQSAEIIILEAAELVPNIGLKSRMLGHPPAINNPPDDTIESMSSTKITSTTTDVIDNEIKKEIGGTVLLNPGNVFQYAFLVEPDKENGNDNYNDNENENMDRNSSFTKPIGRITVGWRRKPFGERGWLTTGDII